MMLVPVDAIETLIKYLWHDEKSDFDAAVATYMERDDEFPDNHVFLAVKRVEGWLKELTACRAIDYTVFPVVRCFESMGDKINANE